MERDIITIDNDKCNGCGECVSACAEGALAIIDGKAKLVSEVYCDGLGACIGDCPQDAITIERREAPSFDEEAVKKHLEKKQAPPVEKPEPLACGCPGTAMRSFGATAAQAAPQPAPQTDSSAPSTSPAGSGVSRLSSWPVQLMLVPPQAPFLKNAHILISAECAPFAVSDFHERFLKGRVPLVGCPKLDDNEHYQKKLAAIIAEADPASVTVVRMEVPCCGGIVRSVVGARDSARPDLPIGVFTVGIQGGTTQDWA